MPFEISPEFQPAKIGTYQRFSDAMLRGCAITTPNDGAYFDGEGRACAMGALALGMVGDVHKAMDLLYQSESELNALRTAYIARYGCGIANDNDSGEFTREQIAERIAAL